MTLDFCSQVRHGRGQKRLYAKAALSVISVADPGFSVGARNDAYNGCKSHNSGPIHTERKRKRKNERMHNKHQRNFSLSLTLLFVVNRSLNVLKINIKFVCGSWVRRCRCSSWIRHEISELPNLGKSSKIL